MPDQTRAQAILAALLLAITIVGIRAAGPAVGWVPPTGRIMIMIGIALELVLTGLLIVVWRRRASSRQQENPTITPDVSPPADLATRLRVILSRILGTSLFVIPVAIALALLRKPRIRVRLRHLVSPATRHHHGAIPPAGIGGGGGSIAFTLVRYGLIIAATVAIAVVVYAAWLRRVPRLPRADAVTDDELTEFPIELARAVEFGRRALRELDDARAAIIGCYLAMERSLAKAGAARRAAETPDELLARAVAGDLVSAWPAGQLTELFYEARFSSHPMPRAKRDEAERALAELAATPQPGRATADAAPGAQAGGGAER